MNSSKVADKRFWNRWEKSGALGNKTEQIIRRSLLKHDEAEAAFASGDMRKAIACQEEAMAILRPHIAELERKLGFYD